MPKLVPTDGILEDLQPKQAVGAWIHNLMGLCGVLAQTSVWSFRIHVMLKTDSD